jgi:hypothetical protein
MPLRSKIEERVSLHVTKELVEEAIAQDPRSCTLACAGHRAGLEGVSFSFDMTTGDVCAAWDELEDESGRIRHHTAIVEPVKRAMQILVATDLDKGRLVRLIPEEGWDVELVSHESRYKQVSRPKAPQTRNGQSIKRKPRRTSSRMMRISGVTT